MRKQATGKKRKIYAEILRLLPVTVLRFTLYAFYPHPICSAGVVGRQEDDDWRIVDIEQEHQTLACRSLLYYCVGVLS